MIVVQTRTSVSPPAKASITFSSWPSGIWPWPTAIRAPGQELAQLLGLGLDRLDAVVDEEDLAAAVELAQDRVADEPGRRLGDARLDRQAVLRRRLDERQVADAGEGQVERPRDRRRRERQDVDLAAQLLEPLLGGHPEALLLVDDDQAQVAEPDVLAEQPVRADDEVDRARRRARRSSPPARCRATKRDEQPDGDREGGEALAEGRVSAARRGRSSAPGRPPAVPSWIALNAAAQRHLGLAVADVADDQPVHRPAGLHVGLDLGGGAQLVERLLVGERGLQLLLPGRVGREGEARRRRPARRRARAAPWRGR